MKDLLRIDEHVTPQCVALTFDDGPHASHTPRVLDALSAEHAKATFFVLGNRVRANAGLLRRMLAEGHEIGVHTYSHPFAPSLDAPAFRDEIQKTRELVSSVTGFWPLLFRPPFGALSEAGRRVVQELGMSSVYWTVDSQDWRLRNPVTIKAQILKSVQHNASVLLHDTYSETVAAVPPLLRELKTRRFECSTVSTMCTGAIGSEVLEIPRPHKVGLHGAFQRVVFALVHDRWCKAYRLFHDRYRHYVLYDRARVPAILKDLLVSAEDHRFHRHCGIDVVAIARALLWTAIGKRPQGASTLEQQLLRVVTGWRERTLRRKVLEIALAYLLDSAASKDDICGMYLANAYYGWRMNSLHEACDRLRLDLNTVSPMDAAGLISRLKYPEPKSPTSIRHRQIVGRAFHILSRHQQLAGEPLQTASQ